MKVVIDINFETGQVNVGGEEKVVSLDLVALAIRAGLTVVERKLLALELQSLQSAAPRIIPRPDLRWDGRPRG